MAKRVSVASPTSIANLGPLYDLAALAISHRYVSVDAAMLSEEHTRIEVSSDAGMESERIAYHTALLLLNELGETLHLRIRVRLGGPIPSGLGAPGAVAASVAYAINELLGNILDKDELAWVAGKAQSIVAGEPHYDTVAAAIHGGLVIVTGREENTIRTIRVEPPDWLHIAIFTPCGKLAERYSIEYMRRIIPSQITTASARTWLEAAVRLAALIAMGEWRASLKAANEGGPIEEARAKEIPGYWEAKRAALEAGAIAFNISGAGPSLFMLTDDKTVIGEAINRVRSVLKPYWGCVEAVETRPEEKGVRIV